MRPFNQPPPIGAAQKPPFPPPTSSLSVHSPPRGNPRHRPLHSTVRPTSPVGADLKPPLFFPLYNSPHLSLTIPSPPHHATPSPSKESRPQPSTFSPNFTPSPHYPTPPSRDNILPQTPMPQPPNRRHHPGRPILPPFRRFTPKGRPSRPGFRLPRPRLPADPSPLRRRHHPRSQRPVPRR